jgi:hypothetical protein
MNELTQEQASEITSAVVNSTGFFLMASPIFKALLDNVNELDKTSSKVAELVSSYFNVEIKPYKEPEQVVEDKESLSSISATTKERAFDLAKLALIIPLLLNKDAREYMASFLKGLFGTETMEGFNTALKVLGGVLVGVFAYKLFQQVADTFKAFNRLSRLVGTLFGLSEAAANSAADEKEELEKKRAADKERRRKARQAKRKRLQKIRKLKSAISKFKFAGPFGLIAGIVIGVGVGTMIDLITNSEEAAEDAAEKAEDADQDPPEDAGEIDTSNLFEIITKNAVETLTMGLITGKTIENTKKVFAGDEKTISENRAAVSGMSTSGAEMGGFGMEEGASTPIPEAPPAPTPAPASGSTSQGAPATQAPVDVPVASIEPAGTKLNETSETVISEKKQQASGPVTVTVNNIDNSTILVKKAA